MSAKWQPQIVIKYETKNVNKIYANNLPKTGDLAAFETSSSLEKRGYLKKE